MLLILHITLDTQCIKNLYLTFNIDHFAHTQHCYAKNKADTDDTCDILAWAAAIAFSISSADAGLMLALPGNQLSLVNITTGKDRHAVGVHAVLYHHNHTRQHLWCDKTPKNSCVRSSESGNRENAINLADSLVTQCNNDPFGDNSPMWPTKCNVM